MSISTETLIWNKLFCRTRESLQRDQFSWRGGWGKSGRNKKSEAGKKREYFNIFTISQCLFVCRLPVCPLLSVCPTSLFYLPRYLLTNFFLFLFCPSGLRWKNSTVYRMAYESTGESYQGLVVELISLILSGILNRRENLFFEYFCFDRSRTSLRSPSHTSLMWSSLWRKCSTAVSRATNPVW